MWDDGVEGEGTGRLSNMRFTCDRMRHLNEAPVPARGQLYGPHWCRKQSGWLMK